MKRVFGVKKEKEPLLQFKMLPIGANLKILVGELINKRGETVDEKITKLDAELSKYKEQIKRTRPGPAQEAVKARAMRVLKQKRMYGGCGSSGKLRCPTLGIKAGAPSVSVSKPLVLRTWFALQAFSHLLQEFMIKLQRDMLYNQTFNLDQVSFAAEGIKDAQQTVISGFENQFGEKWVNSYGKCGELLDLALDLGCKVGALPSSYLGKGRGLERKVSFSDEQSPPLKKVLRDEEDRMFWMVSKSGKFSVKFLFSALEPSDPFLFPWSIIWSSYVPPKVTFFAWKVTWGKALTLDLVQMRGFCCQTDAFFATLKKKPLIIFFSIVQGQGVFGNCCLLSLGFLRPSPPR
ncbi:Vacuolar protein sorting-associated protein 60.1 [Vitis vinifera]|uniref:Vacuolar protein sorting-associated protein 60.1 n=1 Tax=Vitis vinifera TaxID=29760 RepID=A0A438E9K2_VITVI|nr:Vacuolar protein sorting-associated protein 60.1 [Vitis vinifera]